MSPFSALPPPQFASDNRWSCLKESSAVCWYSRTQDPNSRRMRVTLFLHSAGEVEESSADQSALLEKLFCCIHSVILAENADVLFLHFVVIMSQPGSNKTVIQCFHHLNSLTKVQIV